MMARTLSRTCVFANNYNYIFLTKEKSFIGFWHLHYCILAFSFLLVEIPPHLQLSNPLAAQKESFSLNTFQ